MSEAEQENQTSANQGSIATYLEKIGRLLNRQQWATLVALLFHISGFIAILIFRSQLFINLTPVNLLVSCGLLIWTQEKRTIGFWLFFAAAYIIGFGAEYIGIHTQILFGDYYYGEVFGPQWQGVPWLIGITWFGITYCCGIAMSMLQQRILRQVPDKTNGIFRYWSGISFVTDAAGLAVLYDWILEPVAMKLNFWQWKGAYIPPGNYWGWFFVSLLVLLLFRLLPFPKHNLFAVHLLLIQGLFFLLLRTFY
jgi:bisanhydrobacterioruberin hydratase